VQAGDNPSRAAEILRIGRRVFGDKLHAFGLR
jgi:hypothetical protein